MAAALRDDSARIPADIWAQARSKLIVALDYDTIEEAKALVDELGDEVEFYKIGLGLQLAGGDEFARNLKAKGKRVFLDYKYLDIPNTIENAVRQAAKFNIDFLTIHGTRAVFDAAERGRKNSNLKLFCVTVLTYMDAEDLQEMGYPPGIGVEKLVVHRAKKAMEAGLDGVIAAGSEASLIKAVTDGRLMVLSPGIRADGGPIDDQKRIMTAGNAIRNGADYLVLGRPISTAKAPREAAHHIIQQIAEALMVQITAANNPSTAAKPDAPAPRSRRVNTARRC